MNIETRRHLDECLEKAEEDMEELKHNPQRQRELKRIIIGIKHRATMYMAKVEDGQRRAYNLLRDKIYIG